MQMSVGFNNAGTYKELGGKAEVASRNAAWTKAVGSIVARQLHDYDNGKSFGLGGHLNEKSR